VCVCVVGVCVCVWRVCVCVCVCVVSVCVFVYVRVCDREVDSFMILKKVSHVKSHTEFISSVQAVHRLFTIPAPTQSCRRQKGDMKPVP